MAKLRTLLVLGRVSNLPTVWSNCLAGWLLGGAGDWDALWLVCIAGTLLYVGGMFLNDAFDEAFDREHRKERPIPSGAIAARSVWAWGLGFLVGGMACLTALGPSTLQLGALLVLNILAYDALHKHTILSPVIMAGCRFLLVLVAASTGIDGVTGLAVWSALVLGCYVIGLSYIAKAESVPGPLKFWPCLLLAAPVVLAWVANEHPYQVKALAIGAVVCSWICRSLVLTFASNPKQIGRTVSGLLAGIALVDCLAVAGEPMPLAFAFPVCFLLALFAQRFVPAT